MQKFLLLWFSTFRLAVNSIFLFFNRLFSWRPLRSKRNVALWKRLSRFHQNIVIGTCIAIFISLFHNSAFVRTMEDTAMDWMMQMNQSLPRVAGINTEDKEIKGYVFVDIDQETYQAWNEPYHIPRQQLLSLIKIAADNAKIVVVDVDFSKAGIDAHADRELVDFLQSYSQKNHADLILARRLFPGSNRLKPLFFATQDLDQKIHFGLPLFNRDDDYNVRRWFLTKPVCEDDQSLQIGSIQLLANMIALQAEPKKFTALREHHQNLNCTTNKNNQPDTPQSHLAHSPQNTFTYKNRVIDLDAHGIGERLIYTIPNIDQSKDYKKISAMFMLNAGDPSLEFLEDRIVVIGASFMESGDIHATPLGEMPGALVLINAIKSLNQWGQIATPPSWVTWLLEGLLILFMAWVYAKTTAFWGTIWTGILILVTFVPMSFWMFRYGMWIDFALPVFAMQLHQLVAEHEEKGKLKAQKRLS